MLFIVSTVNALEFMIEYMLYLLGALGSLINRDSAKFEKKSLNIFAMVFLSNVNALLLSTALKFEISVFCGMLRDFKVSHSSFGFPIFSESLSSKNARFFFTVINFNVLYFAFLYSSLSIWSLDFLNFLKSLSLVFIFSKTSLSNHFWVFAVTLLVLKGATLLTTILIFWKKFEYASFTSLNSL